jgi:hypothetical protein
MLVLAGPGRGLPDQAFAGSQPTAKRVSEGSVKDTGIRVVRSLVSSRAEWPKNMSSGFLKTALKGLPDAGFCVDTGMSRNIVDK